MNNKSTTYEQLVDKLAELERVIEALRNEDVDAVIGTRDVIFLRLREAEEELRKHRDYLDQLVKLRTRELEEANSQLQIELGRRKKAEEAREKEHGDRLQMYERLAELGRMSGNIAHELRNPLATIGSSVQYLEMTLRNTDEKTKSHLKRIKSAINISQKVIQNLLEHARVKEPVLALVDLRELVSGVVSPNRIPPSIRVVTDFPCQEVPVNADRSQIRLAFDNIVSNAIEAMGGRGTLTVSIRVDGRLARLSFSDTGPGIPPENLEKIFDPLFTTKESGVGFGLSIARMIIGKHNSTIEANSGNPDGAVFTITFPLQSKTEEAGTQR